MSNSKAITAVKLMMTEVERLSKYVDLSLREVELIEGHAVIVSQKNHGCTAVYVFTFTDSPCTTPFTSDLVKWLLQLGDDANVVTATTAVPVEFEITEESIGTLLGLALNFLTVTPACKKRLISTRRVTPGYFTKPKGVIMTKPTLVVNNRYDLRAEILKTTAECGGQVDLNYIDVSRVKVMQSLFSGVLFNGDISKWDVSNVTNMQEMFEGSPFNGDISCWDVSSVKRMDRMFSRSFFNGDISDWNVASLETCDDMFDTSKFTGQCKNIDDRMSVVRKKKVDAQFEALILRNNPEEMARERAKVQREIRRLTDELKALKEGVSVLLDTTSVNWTN